MFTLQVSSSSERKVLPSFKNNCLILVIGAWKNWLVYRIWSREYSSPQNIFQHCILANTYVACGIKVEGYQGWDVWYRTDILLKKDKPPCLGAATLVLFSMPGKIVQWFSWSKQFSALYSWFQNPSFSTKTLLDLCGLLWSFFSVVLASLP